MPLDFLRLMLGFYLLTVAVETAVLLVGLSRRHPVRAPRSRVGYCAIRSTARAW